MVYKKCPGVGTSIIKNKQHCCGVRLSDVLRHEPNHGAKIDNISESYKFLSDYFMFFDKKRLYSVTFLQIIGAVNRLMVGGLLD